MSLHKKIATGLLALTMLFSFSACSDTSWAGKSGDYQVSAGIYIYYTMLAYTQAQSEAAVVAQETESSDSTAETTATTAATTTGTTSEKDLFNAKIDEKDVKTWIQDYATDQVKQLIAVEKQFDELGLKLSDADKNAVNSSLDSTWSSYSEIYEKNGISKASFKKIIEMSYKSSALFDYYYAAGGVEEVSQDEINSYYDENNARVKYIAIQLKDGEGNLFKSAEKTKAMEMAEDYKSRAETESFDDLITEYDEYYAKIVEEATADDTTTDESSEEETSDEEKEVDPYANEHILVKDGSVPSEKVSNKIFETCKVGEVNIVEDDEVYYVVQRLDLLERTDLIEDNSESILHTLKADEFEEKLKTYTDTIDYVKNDDAYKRYDPEDLYFGE